MTEWMNGKFSKRIHVTIRNIPMVPWNLKEEYRQRFLPTGSTTVNIPKKNRHVYSLDFISNSL